MTTTLDLSSSGVADLLSDFEGLALWESMHAGDGTWSAAQLAAATGFPAEVVDGSLRRLERLGLCSRGAPDAAVPSFRAARGPLVVTFDPADAASQIRLATARMGLMSHLQRLSDHHASMPAAAMSRDLVATVGVDPELSAKLGREVGRIKDMLDAGSPGAGASPRATVSLSVRPVRGGLRFPVVLLMPASDAAVGAKPTISTLSGRELEVANLLADGRTKQEIADRLGVSFSTVNTITSRIYRKLGVTRRAALVNALRA